ncbi:MAG: MFS transporter [Klebsiella aerogenes]|nr:MFS transporter [Klebsiella aerogenes]
MSQGLNNDMAVSKTRRVVKNLRWWVLVLFLLGVTVNYITRNSLGIIAPELKATLGITTEQYSWIVGAFQLAYTIFQPLCGWLIDVIGLKLGFMVCATLWAVACIAHAGAGSWLHLAILRFFMGGAEAAATPANAKTIGEWFPKSERPIAAGWAGVGFSIGAMLAPPIIYFAHASFGWQGAFMFTGVLALLWVVLWWVFYQSPEKHPNLSQSELEYIKQDNEAPPVKQPFFTALKTVSKNKRFYGIAIPAFMAEPLYLAKEHGMDLKQIAMFAWLPFLAADLGSVVSGYLTRLYVRWFGCTRVNSVIASSVTGAFLMISLALVAITRDPYITWIASFLFSLLIGVTADKIGFNPLFIAMGFFDLIGAVFLVAFIAERRAKRA